MLHKVDAEWKCADGLISLNDADGETSLEISTCYVFK